ncbi:hypothetical protein TWF569_011368 [Orbilia oligospora]|uniref:GDT1 family protein n=1 Tax=Orbilia oligospora TaxID=2813651 RepID=A0A7C8JD90_ORBOL|nr:hypothetical protein TWF103_011745 [Orbilia oligospora]KAF3093730.1 hypothetical protein TWF706_008642 [Orbilia oligospora]KAF3103958.1 hypothetical protein TWF102_003341 [Orbilia oligospora]KAF3138059.1 hypothetical protein TWF594_007316 [Orbilia oligospora]KAF3154713.1 hypothetical protein TWF569_011368 [Orbilia oligospora]
MILRQLFPRLGLSLVLLSALASHNLVSATIKGDKEIKEPDPLPPRPPPISLVPKVTRSEIGDDDDIPITRKTIKTVVDETPSDGKVQHSSSSVDTGPTTSSEEANGRLDESELPLNSDHIGNLIDDKETLISPTHSFTLSFLMIIFSEIGDKTFLIAALMAMKHSRTLVFSAAFSSLVVMTVLSAVLGHAVPTLLPKRFTNWLASGLFFIFGVRMLMDGLKMEKGTAGVQEEMREVEQELQEKEQEARGRTGSNASMMEEGIVPPRSQKRNPLRRSNSPTISDDSDDESYDKRNGSGNNIKVVADGVQNLAALLLSPAWVQTFVMTFLGEWGDRSQIATIAMAAGQDYWFVILGAIVGHGCCTAGAVIGGKFLAEKISVRNVTLGGAIAFLAFGFIYMLEAIYS